MKPETGLLLALVFAGAIGLATSIWRPGNRHPDAVFIREAAKEITHEIVNINEPMHCETCTCHETHTKH